MAKMVEKAEDIENKTPSTKPAKPKKKKGFLIILVLLLLIGVVGFIFRKPLGKLLKDVPVVGSFIPVEEESKLSYNELQSKLATTELETTTLKGKVENYEAEIKALEEKIETLKQYETSYSNFLAQKETWDESVAGTNKELFIEQFEQMYPETAEKIYSQFKSKSVMSKEQKSYASTIGQMDAQQAAKALEILLGTDPELIQMIFENMGQEQKAAIMDNMSSEKAAQAIKLISPDMTESE